MKPTIEYLDSLNEYRKRSRSRDDVGTGATTPKMSRIDDHASAAETESALYTNGVEAEAPPQTNGVAVEDDPMVYGTSYCQCSFLDAANASPISVNGEPVPLSQVTEEHQEAMTTDEYTAYYEVLSAQS